MKTSLQVLLALGTVAALAALVAKHYMETYASFTVPPLVMVKEVSLSPRKIPRVVVRTAPSMTLPDVFKGVVSSTVNPNPEYEHVFFTDEQCAAFMKEHYPGRVAEAYDKIIPGAYKSDLWRMCYLYKNGGVYLDMTKSMMRPLAQVLDDDYDLVTVLDGDPCCIYQAFLCCRPGLPVMKLCIERAVTNIEAEYYGFDCLDITGPRMMGAVFREYYGQCFNQPGVYRKNGDYIRLFKHGGRTVQDEYLEDVIHINGHLRKQMNRAWQAQTSVPHYGILYDRRQVYRR